MSVRAKFNVSNISNDISQGISITLKPVTGGSEENKGFYKYTPYGEIKLNTLNEAAAKYFELGEEYYIDFTKASQE